jgi:ABC-type transport system substrate-binding protein
MFQDAKVRRALAHAVNVPQMIEYILYGQGTQCTGIFPPQMWFANRSIKPYEYDPVKAKTLLAEAGWKPGPDGVLQKDGKKFEFTLITNHPNEIRKDIATLVQSDLKKIGIKVDVQLYEWAVFIAQYINKQDFDACVLGWSLSLDYDQYQLWHSSQAAGERLNFVSYKSKEVDRLLVLARSEFDEEKAKKYCHDLQRIIYEDQPYLFLDVPKSTGAMHRGSFRVKRPDGKGGWIDEPIRSTKLGFRMYQDWWYRP